MNVSGYTFNYCTLEDAAGQPHIIVPPDRNGIPCFPGDLVCDECDTECKNPFAARTGSSTSLTRCFTFSRIRLLIPGLQRRLLNLRSLSPT